MSITKIEKVVLGIMLVCVIVICFNLYVIRCKIVKAGEIKQVVIEAGKEIKDIKRQINTEIQE